MGGKECGCSDGFQLGDDQTSCVLKGKLKSEEEHLSGPRMKTSAN